MAHVVVAAESLPETFEGWKNWLREFEFKTGGRPVVREIRFFDINYKEEDEHEFLKRLVSNESIGTWGETKKIGLLNKAIRMLFPVLKSIEKEKKKAHEEEVLNGRPSCYPGGWLYLNIIGKVEDGYDEYGVEKL